MNATGRIIFEKPDLETLKKHYTVFDMHFHTKYSDGMNRVKTIAQHARKLGIGIAITDHNTIAGAVEMDAETDVLSIPGIELTSKKGTHVIIYFYDIDSLSRFYREDVKPFMGNEIMSSLSLRMEDIVERAKTYKTVVIFPHPYSVMFTGICNFNFPQKRLKCMFDLADGVEVINSGNLHKWNLKCAVLGFNLNKAIVGGSDGHSISQMGKAVSYADCEKTRESFLDAVKNRENKVVGKEINLFRKVTSNSMKLRASLKNYPENLEKNILYSYNVIHIKSKTIKDNVRQKINGRLRKKEKS